MVSGGGKQPSASKTTRRKCLVVSGTLAVLVVVVCAHFAYQSALDQRRSRDASALMQLGVNVRRIALAVNAYERDTGMSVDSAAPVDGSNDRRTSWRIRVLPYVLPYVYENGQGGYGVYGSPRLDEIDRDMAYRELFSLGLSPRHNRQGLTSIYLVAHTVGDPQAVCVVVVPNNVEPWLTPSGPMQLSDVAAVVPRLVASGSGNVTYIEDGGE